MKELRDKRHTLTIALLTINSFVAACVIGERAGYYMADPFRFLVFGRTAVTTFRMDISENGQSERVKCPTFMNKNKVLFALFTWVTLNI